MLGRSTRGSEPLTQPFHTVCMARGYCGPFLNQVYYDSLAAWRGFGDCVECGCTVPIPRGERGMDSLARFVDSISRAAPPE